MGKSIYQFYERNIAANKIEVFNIDGRFFTVLDWDGAIDPFISIGDQPEEQFPSGVSVELTDETNLSFFDTIRVRNTNASTAKISFAVSSGRLFDNRLTLSGSTFTEILNQMKGQTNAGTYGLVPIANATATKILDVNSNRKSFIIQNIPNNNGIMYLGKDNQVTNTNFMAAILPGQFFSRSDYQGEIWGAAGTNGENVSFSDD